MRVTYTGLVLVVTISLPFYLVVYFFQLGEVNYWKPGEGLVSGVINQSWRGKTDLL